MIIQYDGIGIEVEDVQEDYFIHVNDRKPLTMKLKHAGNAKKLEIEIHITHDPQVKITSAPSIITESKIIKESTIATEIIVDKLTRGASKEITLWLCPKDSGVYTFVFTLHCDDNETKIGTLQINAINILSNLDLFYELYGGISNIMELINYSDSFNLDQYKSNPKSNLAKFYSHSENYDIYQIELDHACAIIDLIFKVHQKYNGLFSDPVVDFLKKVEENFSNLSSRIKAKDDQFDILPEIESILTSLHIDEFTLLNLKHGEPFPHFPLIE